MTPTTVFWLAHWFSPRTGYALHLNHDPTRTYSSNILTSNFITMIIPTFALFQHTSSPAVSTSLKKYNIASLTNSTKSDLMHQCQGAHPLGSLSRSILILFTCATQTAKYFCQISLRHRQQQSKLSLTVQSVLVFHHANAGFKLTPTTRNYALSGT